MNEPIRATTVICVRRKGRVVMAADGQVTLGDTIIKHTANKLRKLEERVLTGFAGATADAFTLLERFEAKLKDYSGNVPRAAVELTKDWRTDRILRRLEALLLIATEDRLFLLSGTGDVLEPDGEVIAIGSGGKIAQAAAQALCEYTELSAEEVARAAMDIAGKTCIYTNASLRMEQLP